MKKINFPRIIERLVAKLKLSELSQSEELILLPNVQLTSNVDDVLTENTATFYEITPSGTGWQSPVTVPSGERWLVQFFYINHTGTQTFDAVAIGSDSQRIRIAEPGAGQNTYTYEGKDFILDAGETIDVNLDAHTSGDLRVTVHYRKIAWKK